MSNQDFDKLIELSQHPASDDEAMQEFCALWENLCDELVKDGTFKNRLDAAGYLNRLCNGQVKP